MADKFGVQWYYTFKRSATNWEEYSKARRITVDTCLTLAEARQQCADYNDNRTTEQIRRGTMMEFDRS